MSRKPETIDTQIASLRAQLFGCNDPAEVHAINFEIERLKTAALKRLHKIK